MRDKLIWFLVLVFISFIFRLNIKASEWPMLRGNIHRTATGEGISDITNPTIKWRYYLGGSINSREVYVGDINQDGNKDILMLVGGKAILKDPEGNIIWDTRALNLSNILGVVDLDGNGTLEVVINKYSAPGGIYVLNGQTGDILWSKTDFSEQAKMRNTTWALVDVTGDNRPELIVKPYDWYPLMHCFTFPYSYNPIELWTFDMSGYYYNYNPFIIDDIDSDGVKEVVVLVYQGFLVLNAQTGVLEQQHTIANSGYIFGLIASTQVDSDPQPELVLYGASIYCDMVGVFEITPQTVTEKWVHIFDHYGNNIVFNFNNSFTAISDIDGDNVNELIGTLYNYTGDNKWHLMVWRGSDGVVLANLTDKYFVAATDIDSDNKAEILAKNVSSGGYLVNNYETIIAYDYENNSLVQKWSINNSDVAMTVSRSNAPVIPFLNIPVTWDIDNDSKLELFIKTDNDLDPLGDVLYAYNPELVPPTIQASYSVPQWVDISVIWSQGQIVNGHQNQTLLNSNNGFLNILDSDLSLYNSIETGGFRSTIFCKDINSDGQMEVFIRNSQSLLQNLNLTNANIYTPPTVNWQIYGLVNDEVLLVDLENDGNSEIVVSDTITKSLKVYRSNRTLKWEVQFPGYSDFPRNLIYGNFNSDNVKDIFCAIYDGVQKHIVALDGTNGNILWNIGLAGGLTNAVPACVTDANNDSIDDIILSWNAAQGRLINGVNGNTITNYIFNGSLYGRGIIVANFEGDSGLEVAFSPGEFGTTMFGNLLNSSYTWKNTYPYATRYQLKTTIANVSGDTDNSVDLLEGTTTGQILTYRGEDGTLIYSKYLKGGYVYNSDPGDAPSIGWSSSADIDGDGTAEFIIYCDDGYLYAINVEDGSLLWSINLLYPAFYDAVLADVDNDFKLEILLSLSDGYIYCIDQASLQGPAQVRDGIGEDIDISYDTHTYSANWDPVEGATGYAYAVINANNTYIVPWTDAGNNTSITVNNLNLLYGQTYYCLVQAYNVNNISQIVRSDGVTITAPLPTLSTISLLILLLLFSSLLLFTTNHN